MKLHELSPAPGSTKEVKRIGRGHGSGNGKTAGKGHKGQKRPQRRRCTHSVLKAVRCADQTYPEKRFQQHLCKGIRDRKRFRSEQVHRGYCR